MSPIVPDCVWPLAATLGEGAVWHAAERAVYCVDIKGRKIHRLGLTPARQDSWDTPQQPGFVVPTRDGRLLCGMADGLYLVQAVVDSGPQFSLMAAVEPELASNRLNDGHVDACGRLWFGSMDDEETQPTGALYSWSLKDKLVRHDQGYVITNGPALSPDGHTLYHTDTLARTIFAFDVRGDGRLEHKRVFLQLEGPGYPDGMAVDSAGGLWVAMFGGWRIDRFSATGSPMGSVRFPCANVTKLAFGGDDLCSVYVTTATKGLTDDERSAQPLAGGLFSFRSPVAGQPSNHCIAG